MPSAYSAYRSTGGFFRLNNRPLDEVSEVASQDKCLCSGDIILVCESSDSASD